MKGYIHNTKASKIQHASLLRLLGAYYYRLNKWQFAIQQYSESLTLLESILNPGDMDIIEVIIDLASCYMFHSPQRNHAQAETLLRRALELSEKDFPNLCNKGSAELARLLVAQGKMLEAESLLRKLLRI